MFNFYSKIPNNEYTNTIVTIHDLVVNDILMVAE